MKFTILKFAMAMSIVVMVSGCATIVSGSSDEVTFNSSPDGARVYVNGVAVGTTPTAVTLDRKTDQMLRFEKEGYKTYETKMKTTMNGWFFGNVLIGGLIGSTTDAASGAIHEYSPDQYMVALEPVDTNHINGVASRPHAERVREFIVSGYTSLLSDLSNGDGDHLDSLLSMLDVSDEDHDDVIRRLRALSEAHPEIPEFANEVVEHFVANPEE